MIAKPNGCPALFTKRDNCAILVLWTAKPKKGFGYSMNTGGVLGESPRKLASPKPTPIPLFTALKTLNGKRRESYGLENGRRTIIGKTGREIALSDEKPLETTIVKTEKRFCGTLEKGLGRLNLRFSLRMVERFVVAVGRVRLGSYPLTIFMAAEDSTEKRLVLRAA
jgi:hypothetical protein